MATLEQRIAALEARLGPTPLALPPMTIGELTDVPVPGSAIAAAWAQEVSGRVVQRFANKTALNAYAANPGAFAVTLDTGVLYRRAAGGWSQVTPWTNAAIGIVPAGTGTTNVATINVPADPGPRIITASCFLRVDRYTPAAPVTVQLVINGVIHARTDFLSEALDPTGAGGMIAYYASMNVTNVPQSDPATVQMQFVCIAPAASNWAITANPIYNRLDVTAAPKGY